ncbi:hypothetical protein ANCDUO_17325 [Ancylostoma duodenale]|uniref:Protein kinase domain-containing protein n=1 Tax=Ancylostoma duodenale TaxID=51022 RepID=A0A0C2CS11_9BILA|nr:hypothetical protein ANCDUO_17325 [Ancylostoma duodenale]
MKVEKKLQSRRHSKLKMEIAILKLVSAERAQSHFTTIIDRGKKETFFFLVMQLVGRSLANLKMARPMRVYILDFGIARKILNSKGELKAPRQSVRFKALLEDFFPRIS